MKHPTETRHPFSIRVLEQMDSGAKIGWLQPVLLVAVLGYSLSFLAGFLGDPSPEWMEGITALLLGMALWKARRGSIALGGALAVGTIWLEVHSGIFLSGSFHGSGLAVLPVLVAGTGILLGGRPAVGLALLSSLSVPAIVFLGRAVHQAEAVFQLRDVEPVLNLIAVLMGMAVIISVGLRFLGEALLASRSNERRFADLVAGNPDGILALDAEGRLEDLNPAAENLLGITLAEARGKRLEELPLSLGLPPSPIRPIRGFTGDFPTVEWTLTRGSGSQSRLEVVRQSLTRADGTPGMMLILRDLTERREMEARATQFGRIVEEARNEIFVFHRDTLEILMANRGARENLGYSRDEIRGMAMFQIQPTLSPESGKTLARRLFQDEEEVVSLRTIHHRKDGTVYPLEIRFQRGVLDGKPAILAFGTDISEQEEAEEEQRLLQAQLQHAQKMEAVGLLAGGVAHDFNNLLTVIGGCGEILLDIGDEEVRGLTKEILEAQERGATLTQQLLAFARRDIVQVEDLSLPEVVRSSEVLIRRVLSEQVKLQLILENDGDIRADRGQIEQVILNLAANARDAMDGGGTLTIRVESPGMEHGEGGEGEYVALTVEDTGHGMDPRTLERIFEPFYTTKPRGKGTGLGLSTVHGIVTQNEGRITVDSEPGKGSRIRILWPLARPEGEDESPGETELPPSSVGSILVAEDEEGARTLIRTVLEREGHRVTVAKNGAEALELIRDAARSFDLLLTDIVMPGVNGLELADQVRELRPGLPILFMSGFVDAHLQGPEGRPGAINLLAKPFRPAELRKAIRGILQGRQGTPEP